MPRIRYLKPEFFHDEDIATLPYHIRLFYQGLWCFADKAGRLKDRPARLRADIMPYEQKFDVEEALRVLASPKPHSLMKTPFILRYEAGGERFLQILSWDEHQKPHHTEPESTLPAPPSLSPEEEKGREREDKGKCSVTEFSVPQPSKNRSATVLCRISFNHKTKEFEGVTELDKKNWKAAFPACDIEVELKKAREWLLSNPARAYKSNWRRFITNWLSRQQDRGGTNKTSTRPSFGEAPKPEWLKRANTHKERSDT